MRRLKSQQIPQQIQASDRWHGAIHRGKIDSQPLNFQGLIKDNGLIYCILMWNIFGVEANIDQGNTSFANCCMHKRRRNQILINSVISWDVLLYYCLLFAQKFSRSDSCLTPSSTRISQKFPTKYCCLFNHYIKFGINSSVLKKRGTGSENHLSLFCFFTIFR